MQLDQSIVGTEFDAFTVDLERGRMRFFSEVIGESDPVYTDVEAARAAGHPDIPAPPTFLFGLVLEQPNSAQWFDDLGIDLGHVLHAQQDFTYHAVAHAGDQLTFRPRIADVFHKRNGELPFLVREIAVSRADGTPVMEMRDTLAIVEPKEN
jgi:hypothetical protein